MPPRKKVVPVAKETPIQEMPVVFFLKIEETEDDNVDGEDVDIDEI